MLGALPAAGDPGDRSSYLPDWWRGDPPAHFPAERMGPGWLFDLGGEGGGALPESW